MRKASLLISGFTLVTLSALLRADQVAQLPATPVWRLPGMQSAPASMPTPAPAALPAPVISDFTNFPNPFDSRKAGMQGKTEIAYLLAQDSRVTLTIYDLFGRRVLTWNFTAGQNGARAGSNQILWDGTNESGRKVSKGGYLAQLEVETPQTTATVIRKIGVIH